MTTGAEKQRGSTPGEAVAPAKRWWVRWYGRPNAGFEYHGPWWQSGWGGSDMDVPILCAAVTAHTPRRAELVIERAYDEPNGVMEWSFVHERADDWEPWCDRFQKREWMRWPWPAPGGNDGR